MGLIYKATNIINGKSYIGLTTRTLEERKAEHYYSAINQKDNFPFHKAIAKYGIQNFKWEIIEDNIFDKDILAEKEKYWIKQYNTFSQYGYNATPGGQTGIEIQIWKQNNPELAKQAAKEGYAKMKEKLKNNPEIEIKRKQNAEKGIRKYVKEHEEEWRQHSYQNYLNHKKQVDLLFQEIHKQQSKKVICIETGVIYPSASEASRQTGISQGNISSVCRGERKSAGKDAQGNKLHWKFINSEE